MSSNRKKRSVAAVGTFLTDQNSTIHGLYKRALRLMELQKRLKNVIPPPLNDHITVADLNSGTLIIHTTSAAWAARLRFKVPDMLHSLNEGEAESPVKTIRIKIRPPDTPREPAGQSPGISPETARMLQNVADSISDPDLRESLLRLSRNRRENPG